MKEYKFVHNIEWSDRSGQSPSRSGAVPIALILPNGERVETDVDNLASARFELDFPLAQWIRLHNQVTLRENHWGDDPERSFGRCGYALYLHAPENCKFVFGVYCPHCGEQTGEETYSYEETPRSDLEKAHDHCREAFDEEQAEIDAWIAEAQRK